MQTTDPKVCFAKQAKLLFGVLPLLFSVRWTKFRGWSAVDLCCWCCILCSIRYLWKNPKNNLFSFNNLKKEFVRLEFDLVKWSNSPWIRSEGPRFKSWLDQQLRIINYISFSLLFWFVHIFYALYVYMQCWGPRKFLAIKSRNLDIKMFWVSVLGCIQTSGTIIWITSQTIIKPWSIITKIVTCNWWLKYRT